MPRPRRHPSRHASRAMRRARWLAHNYTIQSLPSDRSAASNAGATGHIPPCRRTTRFSVCGARCRRRFRACARILHSIARPSMCTILRCLTRCGFLLLFAAGVTAFHVLPWHHCVNLLVNDSGETCNDKRTLPPYPAARPRQGGGSCEAGHRGPCPRSGGPLGLLTPLDVGEHGLADHSHMSAVCCWSCSLATCCLAGLQADSGEVSCESPALYTPIGFPMKQVLSHGYPPGAADLIGIAR